jgi:Spy/CpxP family protein refolding chaperone
MKPFLITLFLVGIGLAALPLPMARADDGTTSNPAAAPSGPSNSAGAGDQSQRIERFKAAIEQLNLTDAQKDQIKQIRASVTDRKERREQIMNVLTPDQKAKLRDMIMAHRNNAQAGAGT